MSYLVLNEASLPTTIHIIRNIKKILFPKPKDEYLYNIHQEHFAKYYIFKDIAKYIGILIKKQNILPKIFNKDNTEYTNISPMHPGKAKVKPNTIWYTVRNRTSDQYYNKDSNSPLKIIEPIGTEICVQPIKFKDGFYLVSIVFDSENILKIYAITETIPSIKIQEIKIDKTKINNMCSINN